MIGRLRKSMKNIMFYCIIKDYSRHDILRKLSEAVIQFLHKEGYVDSWYTRTEYEEVFQLEKDENDVLYVVIDYDINGVFVSRDPECEDVIAHETIPYYDSYCLDKDLNHLGELEAKAIANANNEALRFIAKEYVEKYSEVSFEYPCVDVDTDGDTVTITRTLGEFKITLVKDGFRYKFIIERNQKKILSRTVGLK